MTRAQITYSSRLKKTFNDSESVRKVSLTDTQMTDTVRSLLSFLTAHITLTTQPSIPHAH